MIQVFRFMGDQEHNLRVSGQTIRNHTDHGKLRGQGATSSIGFTFGIGGVEEAREASRYLKGVVEAEWLMTGYIDEQFFKKAKGLYKSYGEKGSFKKKVYDAESNEYFEDDVVYHDEFSREVVNIKYFSHVGWLKVTGIDLDKRTVLFENEERKNWHFSLLLLKESNSKAIRDTLFLNVCSFVNDLVALNNGVLTPEIEERARKKFNLPDTVQFNILKKK